MGDAPVAGAKPPGALRFFLNDFSRPENSTRCTGNAVTLLMGHHGWGATQREQPPPKKEMISEEQDKGLFLQDTFYLVTDKSAKDEDDEKDKYLDEEAGHAKISDVETHASGNKPLRREHKDDPEDQADNHPVFQETVIVFLPLVEKTKRDTEHQIQDFKPHMDTLIEGSIARHPIKKVSGSV